MQTLWTRLAQSRCFGRSFSRQFSSAALARPSTANPVRWVGADSILAACFSTVAFASAVADSNRKDVKRKEWVRVIREARRELHASEAEGERQLSRLERNGDFQSFGDNEKYESFGESESISSPRHQSWEEVLQWGNYQIRERRELGFEEWQGIPLRVLRNATPEQIQDFLQHHSHLFPRFKGSSGSEVWNTVTWPLSIKKIKTVEWSTARLVLQLMQHAPERRDWYLPSDTSLTEDVLKELSVASTNEAHSSLDHTDEQLSSLRGSERNNEDFYLQFQSPPFPTYCTMPQGDLSSADQLNAKLHELFESRGEHARGILTVLPAVCFYLLMSKAPPNIHTYNLLISEFAGERQEQLIHYLLGAIGHTHMRPNEITLAETLRHYFRTDDRWRFYRHVSRMEGYGRGLGEAHPWLDCPNLVKFQYRVRVLPFESEVKPFQLEYHEMEDLSKPDLQAIKERGRVKIYEKPRKNLEVYRALIQGALHFDGLFGAIRYYKRMTHDGWEPDEEVFMSILSRCAIDHEWEAGFSIWKHLQGCHIPVSGLCRMLMVQLCQRCENRYMIQRILRDGVTQGALPRTILELIRPYDTTGAEMTLTPIEHLELAKEVWDLERRLKDLLPSSRGKYKVTLEDSERIKAIARQIEDCVPHPSPKTIKLLAEAYACTTPTSPECSALTTKLQKSNEQLLDLANELNDIRFAKRVRELGDQIHARCSAISQFSQHCWGILSSIRTRILEEAIEKSTTSIILLTETVETQVSCGNTKVLHARFRHIRDGIRLMQVEMSQYVAGLPLHVVYVCQSVLRKHKRHIRRTSDEVKELIRATHGETVTFEHFGTANVRWRYHVKPVAGALAHQKPTAPKPSLQGIASDKLKEVDSSAEHSMRVIRKTQPRQSRVLRVQGDKTPVKAEDAHTTSTYITEAHSHDDPLAQSHFGEKPWTDSGQTARLPSALGPRIPIKAVEVTDHMARIGYRGWREPPAKLDFGHDDAYRSFHLKLEHG
ncbi:MAG: hypothetical protein Q9218_005076 [Villophora microphyllina]